MAKLALPAGPTGPISKSAQPEGRGAETTVRVNVVLLVKLAEVPVMVTTAVPIVAALPAASVKVLVPVVLAGLKEAVTPVGNPEADRLTLPVNPFCGVIVTALAPLVPWRMLKVFGEAERPKVCDEVTARETKTVFTRLPDLPVMVTVAVPTSAALLAESVSVLVPLVLVGLKEAVTPLGKPDADKLTVPEKPP